MTNILYSLYSVQYGCSNNLLFNQFYFGNAIKNLLKIIVKKNYWLYFKNYFCSFFYWF